MSVEPSIIVVARDRKIRNTCNNLLFDVGYRVQLFESNEQFLNDYYPGHAGCLIAELDSTENQGFALQSTLIDREDGLTMILMANGANLSTAVQAMKRGALDVIEWPMEDDQVLLKAVREALALDQRKRKTREEKSRIAASLAILSEEEREVLRMVCTGCSNREITERLNLGAKLLEDTRGRVMEKMGARSLADLVRMAVIAKLAA